MSDFPDELPDEAPGEAPLFLTDLPELHEHFACLAEEVDESSPTDDTPAANDTSEASAGVAATVGSRSRGQRDPAFHEAFDDENRVVVDEAATAVAPFANDSLNQCSPEELHCNFFFAASTSLGIPGRDFPRKLPDEEPWEAPSFTASARYYTPSALDEYTELCFALLEPSPNG